MSVRIVFKTKMFQDNDFLKKGHRPPLSSFRECFASIFRIHTETGNIWTHLLGVFAFLGLSLYFMTRPLTEIDHQEKVKRPENEDIQGLP